MNLVKLETEHNNIKSYIKRSCIICGIIFLIVFFVLLDGEVYRDTNLLQEEWPSVIYIVTMISLFSFSILSAVMYSKFIVSEYSGKKAILLFSYPIKRAEILKVKCGIITIFSFLSALFTCALVFGSIVIATIFSNPGQMFISKDNAIYMLQMLSVTIVFSVVTGLISGYIGMSGNSIQTTIVSAVINCVIAVQIIGYIYSGDYDAIHFTKAVVVIDLFMLLLGIISYKMLEFKIKAMELE